MAANAHVAPRRRCTRSRNTKARPITITPLGAISPGNTGTRHSPSGTHTVPTLPIIQLASGMLAIKPARYTQPSIRLRTSVCTSVGTFSISIPYSSRPSGLRSSIEPPMIGRICPGGFRFGHVISRSHGQISAYGEVSSRATLPLGVFPTGLSRRGSSPLWKGEGSGEMILLVKLCIGGGESRNFPC